MTNDFHDKLYELCFVGCPLALADDRFMAALVRLIDCELRRVRLELHQRYGHETACQAAAAVARERERWLTRLGNASKS